jgi:DNA repair protein RecN (Recombination protein N)
VRERRQLIVDLRRKYGTATLDGSDAAGGTLGDVVAYREAAAARLATIEGHDEEVQRLEADRDRARKAEARAAAAVAAARRKAAPDLASDVQAHLRTLAMPKARIEVSVEGPDPADDVRFLLAANPGAPPQALAKVASGGELARAMLALRLVLRAAPPVLVFDEVDAGVGGAAAIEVGRALAALGGDHQVLVVTHLPQVAAFADTQVTVTKRDRGGATVSQAATLGPEERIVELSRMLSGTPDSERVRQAASELLATAAEARGR